MTGSLKVNTDELRGVAATFASVGDKLASAKLDAPLADAASAVPGLQTGAACTTAKATVAEEMSRITAGAQTFGVNLRGAAGHYESTDHTSGSNISGVDIPPPAPS